MGLNSNWPVVLASSDIKQLAPSVCVLNKQMQSDPSSQSLDTGAHANWTRTESHRCGEAGVRVQQHPLGTDTV